MFLTYSASAVTTEGQTGGYAFDTALRAAAAAAATLCRCKTGRTIKWALVFPLQLMPFNNKWERRGEEVSGINGREGGWTDCAKTRLEWWTSSKGGEGGEDKEAIKRSKGKRGKKKECKLLLFVPVVARRRAATHKRHRSGKHRQCFVAAAAALNLTPGLIQCQSG